MLGAAAQRIVRPIRKPRNNAYEAIAAKPGWDGACRAICCVAPLANGAYHWLRAASRISSRQASVATTRDLFRGSLMPKRSPTMRFLVAHPAHFLALGFGAGVSPVAPGTIGTLVALPLAVLLRGATGDAGYLITVAAAFGVGVWAADRTGSDL